MVVRHMWGAKSYVELLFKLTLQASFSDGVQKGG